MKHPGQAVKRARAQAFVARSCAVLTLLVPLALAPAQAQPVHKCVVGGKTVYQSTPCANDSGDTVRIIGGPTDEDAAAARLRAQREQRQAAQIERQRQREIEQQNRPRPPERLPDRAGKADADQCKRMDQQRSAAYARRNDLLNAAKRGAGVTAGSSGDRRIGDLNLQIEGMEASMRRAGCTVTP